VIVDREAFEHSLIRRLLDHIEHGTTDLADDVLEVPAETYTSPARLDEELGILFLGHPLVLCLSGALPGPGAYRTVDMCGTPVLLTRDAEGRVRAFANVCRHRGVRVVDGAGQARLFTCPFHAWVYDLEGRLVGVPVSSAFEGMCREEKGLVELPVAEGYGLVVGRLQPGPPVDLDAYLGPDLSQELAMLGLAKWEIFSDPHVHQVAANWKVTLDTFRENYHFDYLHRRTLKGYAYGGVLTFDAFGPHLRNCSAVRTIDELRDRPEEEWGDVMPHFSYQYALFPNTSLTVCSQRLELWQILPLGPATSAVLHTAYVTPELPASERESVAELIRWTCESVVDAEDFWVAGRTEPGIRTGLSETVVFGRNEPAPQHLHRGFAAALSAARDT
jgi:phenylpropionate dioxygenase-like ring-hydroxylating dioxygenase large terminal subunit